MITDWSWRSKIIWARRLIVPPCMLDAKAPQPMFNFDEDVEIGQMMTGAQMKVIVLTRQR